MKGTEPASVDLVGKSLAQYRVLELIGRGGMGEVYRAFDRRLRREVALKVLPSETSTQPKRRRRLLREARAASAVGHPSIVAIHEIGRDGARDFIVMELVRGRLLADRLAREGPLPAPEAVALTIRIAEGLAAAHEAGVVHRDLKPRNVMVAAGGKVKILDFGIAKPLPAAGIETWTDGDSLTSTGVSPGTLTYMSPEQVLAETVDRRSDIFSLGVVLFEMLTGHRPFEEPGRDGASEKRFLRRLLFDPPASLGELRPEAGPGLEAVVEQALAKAPEDRFPDMGSFAAALRAATVVGDGAPAAGPTAGVDTGTGRRSRRSPVVLLLVVASMLAGVLWFSRPSPQGSGEPPAPTSEALHATTALPSLDPTAPSPTTAYQLWQSGESLLLRFDRAGNLERAAELFEEALKLQPDFAPAHSGLARVYWRRFREKRDATWLRRAQDSARAALELAPQWSHARISHALVRILEGRLDEAKVELEELRKLDPGEPDIYRGLAEIALAEERRDDAIEQFRTAVQRRPESWELHAELGRALYSAGRLEEAAESFEESIELAPDNAFAHRNLAAIRHRQGRFEEAVHELQTSITIRPTATAYSNLGTAYFFQGYYRDAAAAFEGALALGANHYLLWANLGDAYRQVPGDEDRARESYRRAVQLLRREIELKGEQRDLQSRLALYLAKGGTPEEALSAMPRLEAGEPENADSWYRASLTYELTGDRQEALHALEQALLAGYPLSEAQSEPELTSLREDVAYHRLASRFDPASASAGDEDGDS